MFKMSVLSDLQYHYYFQVECHFVSDEGEAVEAEVNMPRGLEWNQLLSFRGKQAHTGSRHGCHISLSAPVTPEGSGQGQPLRCGDAMEIYMYSCRDRNTWLDIHMYAIGAHRHKCISICCICWCYCANLIKHCVSTPQQAPSWVLRFDLPSWKAADLVHKQLHF